MKVLHVWNTAGVASLMAKELRTEGIESTVVMRSVFDPFNMTGFYGDMSLNIPSKTFISSVFDMAKHFDVIHVHALYRIIPELRSLYPNKKIVLQHHGTELSNCNKKEYRNHCYKSCDKIITSTEDLSKILNIEGVPHKTIKNAVDTDLFKPLGVGAGAFTFNIRYLDFESVKKNIAKFVDWGYKVIDREVENYPFETMPELFNQYARYIDIKCYEWTNGEPAEDLSKTGREALACGLEVLNYKGDIISGLPIEFTPKFMVEELIKSYK